jgi:SAM-dependent methyltransferase
VAVDPILIHESKMPNSAFTTGKFVDSRNVSYPTTLHQVGAEAVGSLYSRAFDTVIMMNVIEHVVSAYDVLESIVNVTRPGGIVIFWEPSYSAWWDWGSSALQNLLLDASLPVQARVTDPDWSNLQVRNTIRSRAFDLIAHPVRVDPSVYQYFASFFRPLHSKISHLDDHPRRGDGAISLIGRLKQHRKPTKD